MKIAEFEFDLDTDLEKEIYFGHVFGSKINFSYTGADATDGSILFREGDEYGVAPLEAAYTLSAASNTIQAKQIQLDFVISRVRIEYSKGANSTGTGVFQLVKEDK